MTPEQETAVTQCKARFEEMRRIGHHDGSIAADLRREGYPEAAIIAGREAAGGSDD